jgi:CspA family cold shock protein
MKWFDAEKGYGFIARDDGAEDVFVHISALERSGLTGLSEGQQVVVHVVEGRKGPESRAGALGLGRGRRGKQLRVDQATA